MQRWGSQRGDNLEDDNSAVHAGNADDYSTNVDGDNVDGFGEGDSDGDDVDGGNNDENPPSAADGRQWSV